MKKLIIPIVHRILHYSLHLICFDYRFYFFLKAFPTQTQEEVVYLENLYFNLVVYKEFSFNHILGTAVEFGLRIMKKRVNVTVSANMRRSVLPTQVQTRSFHVVSC